MVVKVYLYGYRAKTASRNVVAFKSGKMMDASFQGKSMAHASQSSLDPDCKLRQVLDLVRLDQWSI